MKKTTVKIKPLYKTGNKKRKDDYINGNAEIKNTVKDEVENEKNNEMKDDIKIAMSGNKNMFSSSNLGIRDGLNALGFDNEAIGWDGENVTYNDKPAFVPDRNDNGTTKINTAGFVKGVNRLYGDTGNYLADVTAYAANSGLSNAVEYGNEGVVSIGGVPVRNAVIIDGQAYASTNDIKNAINAAAAYSGIKSPVDVYESNFGENGRYGKSIDKLVNKLVNREEFSYNPEKDPAYLAYKDMYMRNGAEARDNAYGTLAARTGGYGNSAATAAAGNAYFSYINALNDKIPELYKDAYDRYRQENESDIKLLSQLGTPKDIYSYHASANSDMRKDINAAMKADYDRNINSKTYSAQRDDAMFDRNHKTALLEQDKVQNEFQNELDLKRIYMDEQQNIVSDDIAKREIAIKEDENFRQNQLIIYEIEKLKAEIDKLKAG